MILALNIGSSNIKFALFRTRPELQELLRGSLDEFQGFPQLKVDGPLGCGSACKKDPVSGVIGV
ncbi:MAG: hypothetical protein ACOY7L_10685 [Pseudomonadota bacterium]